MAQPEIASPVRSYRFCGTKYFRLCPFHSAAELQKAEEDFVEAEEAVKTGRLQDVLSVELLIVKYSSAR